MILFGAILGAMTATATRSSPSPRANAAAWPRNRASRSCCEDFTDAYDPVTGAPIDYASQVVLYKDGAEIDRHIVRVNDPLRHEGLTFYQAFYGAAAAITVKGAEGETLVDPRASPSRGDQRRDRPIGSFNIPGTPYVGWVTGTLGNGDTHIAPGQVRVELYTAGEGDRPWPRRS